MPVTRDAAKSGARPRRGRALPRDPCLAAVLGRAGGSLAERRLGCRQPRDRDAEWRARHVVEPDLMAGRSRGGIAAVLAADAELQVALDLAPALRSHPYQFADAGAVQRHVRIGRQNAPSRVDAEKACRIVAAD